MIAAAAGLSTAVAFFASQISSSNADALDRFRQAIIRWAEDAKLVNESDDPDGFNRHYQVVQHRLSALLPQATDMRRFQALLPLVALILFHFAALLIVLLRGPSSPTITPADWNLDLLGVTGLLLSNLVVSYWAFHGVKESRTSQYRELTSLANAELELLELMNTEGYVVQARQSAIVVGAIDAELASVETLHLKDTQLADALLQNALPK